MKKYIPILIIASIILITGCQPSGNAERTQLGESIINPETSSIMDTMKDMGSGGVSSIGGIGESVENVDEDGHCRSDEKPVSGVIAGQEGSCEKKDNQHLNPEDEGGNNIVLRLNQENGYFINVIQGDMEITDYQLGDGDNYITIYQNQ